MPVSTENNLLFGLLALQNGFVEQPTLVAAFHAWTHNKARSIADILLGQGTIDTDERALLEGLAVKHLRRHGDDIEKSASAVSPPRWIVNELAEVGDPDLTTTLGHFAVSNPQPTWPRRRIPPKRSRWEEQPRMASVFASCDRMPTEAWEPCSWRSTPS